MAHKGMMSKDEIEAHIAGKSAPQIMEAYKGVAKKAMYPDMSNKQQAAVVRSAKKK